MADGASAPGSPPPDGEVSPYFRTRLAPNPHRAAVWKHVCAYLQRWIPADAAVLDLGAGWCDFANTITARRVVAMDLDTTVRRAAAEHVQAEVGDCTDLSRFEEGSFDVVFASNLLEHLERPATTRLLAEAARVLRPGGNLILLQPNFRLNPGGYFDDYTHVAIYTDRSLADYLRSEGWRIVQVYPAVPAVDDEEQGLRADVPGALVSPLPRQTAGRSDVADRHARSPEQMAGHVER